MHRFFVPPDAVAAGRVRFSAAQAHQIVNVLRLRAGDRVKVLDDTGWEYEVELISLDRQSAEGRVRRKALATTEPRVKIVLYQAVLKGHRFELVLQKGTELGIVGFVPVVCERCVVGNLTDIESKLARWQRIIQEAAEQSHRAKLPQLQRPMLFEQACSNLQGLALLPWEEERQYGLRSFLRNLSTRPFTVHLFIGPEGGFSPGEVQVARHYGIRTVSLGPRVLRAETAGLAAAAAILYEWGDLGDSECSSH